MIRLISILGLLFLVSCQFIPLLTSPEAIMVEKEVVKDVIDLLEEHTQQQSM